MSHDAIASSSRVKLNFTTPLLSASALAALAPSASSSSWTSRKTKTIYATEPAVVQSGKRRFAEPLLIHASSLRQKQTLDHGGSQNTRTDAQAQTYATIDHPRHALNVLCNDVRQLQVCLSPGSLRTFIHRSHSLVYAQIVGRVVGIEPKERKVVWLIDDGTGVVAVHHTLNTRPVQRPSSRSKGKQKASGKDDQPHYAAEEVHGIPEEYIRPGTPPPKAAPLADVDPRLFEKQIRHIKICTLVKVLGKVDIRFEGERVLHADRVIPAQRTSEDERVRNARESFIEELYDVNEEAKHAVSAIELVLSDVQQKRCPEHASSTLQQQQQQQQQQYEMRSRSILQEQRKHRVNEAANLTDIHEPTLPPSSIRKESTKPFQVKKESPIEIKMTSRSSQAEKSASPSSRRLRDYRKLPPSQLTEQLLRIYVQKHIVDNCSKTLLHVDERSGEQAAIVLSDSSNDEQDMRSARPLKRLKHAAKLSNHSQVQEQAKTANKQKDQPPAFALAYLLRVRSLNAIAFKVVANELRKQKIRRMQKQQQLELCQTSSSARRSSSSSFGNGEPDAFKVRRLFEAIVRDMASDGMIVVADPSRTNVQSPFDGLKPLRLKNLRKLDPKGLLAWDDEYADTGDNSAQRSSSHLMQADDDTSMMRWQGANVSLSSRSDAIKTDLYQLVTPALLAPVVLRLAGIDVTMTTAAAWAAKNMTKRLGTTIHIHQPDSLHQDQLCATAAAKRSIAPRVLQFVETASPERVLDMVRMHDDRWRRVRLDAIKDCLAYVHAEYTSL